MSTAAERRARTAEREAELEALSHDEKPLAKLRFACDDAVTDSQSPPTERYYTAVAELALPSNPNETLRKLAENLIKIQSAFLAAAQRVVDEAEAEEQLAADMAAAEIRIQSEA